MLKGIVTVLTMMQCEYLPSDCLHSYFAESQGFLDVRLSTVKIA